MDVNQLAHLKQFANKNPKASRRKTNQVVIYTRVSSKDQMDNGASLETQKKYCEEFAEKRGLNVIAYFGGTYESAKTDDRKEFQRMISFVKKSKEVSGIVVYSYDRFSRSGNSGAMISEDLQKKYGVVTISVTQEIDPTNPTGAFQRDLFYLFSKFDNTQRREKCITGMKEKLRAGYWVWKAPRGYKNLNMGQTADKQQLVITKEGELLREAFRWKADLDMPTVEISRKLADLGLKITDKKLCDLFQNTFYCGVITSELIPGETIQGKHEPLVSIDTFLAVNSVSKERPRQKGYKVQLHNDELPLKVFTSCDHCGTPMTGYVVKKKGLYYYKCRSKGCAKNRNANVVKEHFEELLSTYQLDNRYSEVLATQMKKLFFTLNENKLKEVQTYKTNLTSVQNKLDSIEERYVLGEIDKPIFEKYQSKYTEEKLRLVDFIENSAVSSSNLEKCIDYAVNMSGNLLEMWRKADIYGKQTIQSTVFPDGIRYNRDLDTVRTDRVNVYFSVIPTLSAHFSPKKQKGKHFNNTFPHLVEPEGFEPSSR